MPYLKKRNEPIPKRQGSNNRDIYQSNRWHEYSRNYRKKHPLCVECLKNGVTKRSQCVDHVVPLTILIDMGYDPFDSRFHQALDIVCHNKKTKSDRSKSTEYFLGILDKLIIKSFSNDNN